MRLNCILQDLFRDTPHNHIQMRAYTVYGAPIWVCQIWSSQASLKKILQNTVQTRWSFGSVGPPVKSYDQISFLPAQYEFPKFDFCVTKWSSTKQNDENHDNLFPSSSNPVGMGNGTAALEALRTKHPLRWKSSIILFVAANNLPILLLSDLFLSSESFLFLSKTHLL